MIWSLLMWFFLGFTLGWSVRAVIHWFADYRLHKIIDETLGRIKSRKNKLPEPPEILDPTRAWAEGEAPVVAAGMDKTILAAALGKPPPTNKEREKFLKKYKKGKYDPRSEFYQGMD